MKMLKEMIKMIPRGRLGESTEHVTLKDLTFNDIQEIIQAAQRKVRHDTGIKIQHIKSIKPSGDNYLVDFEHTDSQDNVALMPVLMSFDFDRSKAAEYHSLSVKKKMSSEISDLISNIKVLEVKIRYYDENGYRGSPRTIYSEIGGELDEETMQDKISKGIETSKLKSAALNVAFQKFAQLRKDFENGDKSLKAAMDKAEEEYEKKKQEFKSVSEGSSERAFAAGYNEGDVVKVHTHTMGKDTGSYGKFNVLRVTPTQLHLADHNEGGKVMKFNLKTKRGIGEHDNLLIKEAKGPTFSATGDHEVEQNEVWIHVAEDGNYDSSGINVVFHKSGKIDGTPGDSAAEEAWDNHRADIIKAAKAMIAKRKDIKDHMQDWK